MTDLRVAYGPLELGTPNDWPIYGHEALQADGFRVLPFADPHVIPDADAVVWHSPEYAAPSVAFTQHTGFKTGLIGDHHIVPFERVPLVYTFDLIGTDWRGTRRLAELNYPTEKTLWYRMFAHDPRLHFCTGNETRDIDLAFMGRPVPERHDTLMRLVEWAKRTGRSAYLTTDQYPRGKEAEYYRRSKLTWNMSQRGEVNMRAYEAAACGSLSLLNMDADELWQSGAPLVPWQPSTLEEQLSAWLEDDAAREKKVRQQAAWAAKETPARHLAFLCRAIKERVEQRNGLVSVLGTSSGIRIGGDVGGVDGGSGDDSKGAGTPGVAGQTAVVQQQQTPDPPPHNEQRLECLALVPQSAKRVLDVGSSRGGFLWALKQQRPDLQALGIEPEENDADIAGQRLGEGVTIHRGSVEDFLASVQGPSSLAWRNQDAITMLDVIEHLVDPWYALRHLRSFLAPDGVLIASIPNIRNVANLAHVMILGDWRYHRNGIDPFEGPHCNVLSMQHLRFFTQRSIQRMVEECGYRIERWEASTLTAPSLTHLVDEIAFLCAKYGDQGAADEWKAAHNVIQHLVVARPDWSVAI